MSESSAALERDARSRELPSSGDASIVDDLPDGVLVLDRSGRILRSNPAFLGLLERSAEEIHGREIAAIVADDDILHLVGFDALLRDPLHDNSIIFLAKSGVPRALLVDSAPSSDGRTVLLVVHAHGSVRKELEDTVRWAAAERDRARELAEARDALESKNAALRLAQGELENAYRTLWDEVATRERLENELRLAQKLEATGQLAAGLAHELNTPLQYIGDNLGFLRTVVEQLFEHASCVASAIELAANVQQARSELAALATRADLEYLREDAPRAFRAAEQGVQQVTKIVRAMKSFARPEQQEKSLGDLNQALRDTLVVARATHKNVSITESELAELPQLTCFWGALNQAFLNLLTNAAQAIADADRGEDGCIRVSSRLVEGMVEVVIADNGCGIPDSVKNRVFDPFFTTKSVGRGSGQGLSAARSVIVEAHGGTLSFTSEVGQGSTFVVRLPLTA